MAIMREESIYVTVFLQSVRDPELTFFTDETWFHLSDYINAQNNRYWSSINLKTLFLSIPS
jgi:hypothetical protein